MHECFCIVCGELFLNRNINANACSLDCKRIRQREYLARWRSINKVTDVSNCEWCGSQFEITRKRKLTCSAYCESENAKDKKIEHDRLYYRKNSVRISYYQKERYKKDTKSFVANQLRRNLGFTPPPELVEEATALRLLRRAIKKAGE